MYPWGAGHGKKNVFRIIASKPLLFGVARTAIFPGTDIDQRPWACLGSGVSRKWSKQLAGTYTETCRGANGRVMFAMP